MRWLMLIESACASRDGTLHVFGNQDRADARQLTKYGCLQRTARQPSHTKRWNRGSRYSVTDKGREFYAVIVDVLQRAGRTYPKE